MNNKKDYSALSVSKGIEQPPSISSDSALQFLQKKRKALSIEDYFKQIRLGNRVVLSQAITLAESSLPSHREIARSIIEKCLPFTGNSIRVGITGVPGVGKSTFIESLGKHVTGLGQKLAVLAIDPSSERSKGSILGDKTRMEELSVDQNAFIRPSPSAGSLGGVARKTRETIILCEAAGFDVIFIETVGVGQSETAVHSMTDFFLLLMLAGAGDELQGIKRGIMEMADLIAITKADGANIEKAEMAKAEYQNALHLFPLTESGWTPPVVTCSSRNKTGINSIWDQILQYKSQCTANQYFYHKRSLQSRYWMFETIHEELRENFYGHPSVQSKIEPLINEVLCNKKSSFEAARQLLDEYFNNNPVK